jgi:hypothetical protein
MGPVFRIGATRREERGDAQVDAGKMRIGEGVLHDE